MPRKIHSKAQSRKIWAEVRKGNISKKTAEEMHQGVNVKKLPARKKKRKRRK